MDDHIAHKIMHKTDENKINSPTATTLPTKRLKLNPNPPPKKRTRRQNRVNPDIAEEPKQDLSNRPSTSHSGNLNGGVMFKDDTPCRYVLSTKGNPMIAYGDFLFRKKSGTGPRSYWICSHDRGYKCKSRIRVLEGSDPPKIIGISGEHNHGIDFGSVEAREAVNKMKEEALQSDETTDEIYKRCMSEEAFPDEVLVALSSKHAVLAAMRRARKREKERLIKQAAFRQVVTQVMAENTAIDLSMPNVEIENTNKESLSDIPLNKTKYLQISSEQCSTNIESYESTDHNVDVITAEATEPIDPQK